MTLDESMDPVVCAACNREPPVGPAAGGSGTGQVEPEQLHGLGWVFAAGGGWVCGECAPTFRK